MDENHEIPVFLEEKYEKTTDFFIIRYPTYNWKTIESSLNGHCLEESF